MIWFQPRPWADRHEMALYVAVFGADEANSLRAAVGWFASTPIERIDYRHHRLIAAVEHRFRGQAELDPYRSLITSVAKQLWLRGARVMAVLAHLSKTFETMNVPWMIIGNAAWQCRGDAMFRDVERAEIVVAEEAFTYAMSRLWDVGWKPNDDIQIFKAPDPVYLTDPRRSVLRLQSDRAILAADPSLMPRDLWQQVERDEAFTGVFPLPSTDLVLRYRDTSPELGDDDFQWAVDLAELRRRGLVSEADVPTQFRSLARRARLLTLLPA